MVNDSDISLPTTISTDRTCLLEIPSLLSVVQGVQLKETLQNLFSSQLNLEKITLDFARTVFMDSSGIGALVNCRKMAQEQEVLLTLTRVPEPVKVVLQMTELDQVFVIESELQEPVPNTTELSQLNTDVSDSAINAAASGPIITHPSVRSRAKRLLDITGALVGLGITAILFVPIAIAIKVDDGGPIFFGQVRCSWLGRRFKMWKFRSMVVNAEAIRDQVTNHAKGALFKNPKDPRITRVGRFLRRTSLDEFPQFWNVFRGDMSLVGTRPPTPDEIARYDIPQWQRLDIKPGITGEWQVSGRSRITNFEEVVKLDLQYQEKWSLWYDLQILVRTVLVLFNKNSGAY